jgi:hypothetical protein
MNGLYSFCDLSVMQQVRCVTSTVGRLQPIHLLSRLRSIAARRQRKFGARRPVHRANPPRRSVVGHGHRGSTAATVSRDARLVGADQRNHFCRVGGQGFVPALTLPHQCESETVPVLGPDRLNHRRVQPGVLTHQLQRLAHRRHSGIIRFRIQDLAIANDVVYQND